MPEAKWMTTPVSMRERALRIREVALGFNDGVSRTLIELADDLDAMAAELETEEAARSEAQK